jgi:autotransporter-associated beta strand protein
MAGGTLALSNGDQSNQNFSVETTSTITAPTTGSATLSGVFSGSGGLIFNGVGTTILTGANTYTGGTTVLSGVLQGNTTSLQGAIVNNSQVVFDQATEGTYSGVMSGTGSLVKQNTGTLILTGANTYTGGTTVSSGTLSVSGASPTGFGNVLVSSGATLMGTGTINGQLTVAGILKPGNSPGYLAATNTVTMNAGSIYMQDIAGRAQATSTTPVGATGYYSALNITGGQFVINSGSTLTPRLSNLFTSSESGYGSTPYTPVLGDRFRMVKADGGISGRFSTITQPAELAAGTQFLPFYNMAGSNSVDLSVIPTAYQTTIASASGNSNAKSVGAALTQIAQASMAGTATPAQERLLYSIAGQTTAQGISNFAQSLSGEVYAATVAVLAQTTQRTQQAVLNRLGDTAGLTMTTPMASSSTSTQVGGAPSAAVSSNPSVDPSAEAKAFSKGNVWGELAYQRGSRANDSQSGGWSSNLYQLTFGSDFYSVDGKTAGAGFALSSTTINPVYGSSTIQQGSLFAYGKMPVESFVVDAMASVGLSSSDIKRGDVTGLSTGFRNNAVSGNDVMLSLGVSRPMDLESLRITPFARVTWQMVSQSGVNESGVASALSVNRYTGNGVRGVIGLAAGSKANNPMTAKNTYRAYVGVGADSSGLLNPTLNASLAGIGTNITTPNAGTAFVQAGLYGTAKMSENTFAYAGISGEARSGQTLGTINLGLKLQF